MRLARSACLVVVALGGALTGCSGGHGYSASVEGAFVVACNPDHDATREQACRCAYERYSAAHGYDDFVVVDRSLQAEPDKIPVDLARFMTACAVEASEASSSSSSASSSSTSSSSTSSSSTSSSSTSSSSSSSSSRSASSSSASASVPRP